MPRVPPFDRPATYEDLCALADNLVGEIVGGDLYASPRPALPHARAGSALGGYLQPTYDRGRAGPGGWWILDEPELHLGEDVLVPDLAGWRRTRMPFIPAAPYSSLAPDWICEILSPSTTLLDRTRKLDIYAREGVADAWLIDPIARTFEGLRLEGERWVILVTRGGNETVRAEPFSEVEIPLESLWAE